MLALEGLQLSKRIAHQYGDLRASALLNDMNMLIRKFIREYRELTISLQDCVSDSDMKREIPKQEFENVKKTIG